MFPKLKVDTVIFGYGEITNLLIKKFLLNDQKILCVTNNNKLIENDKSDGLEFLSYSQVLNYHVESNNCIFTWRNKSKLKDIGFNFINWFGSDSVRISKSLFLSSASVYKDSGNKQTENLNIDTYSDKFILEEYLMQLLKTKSTVHLNLRISNVYGMHLNYGFINSLYNAYKHHKVSNIFNEKEITRDYIYVEDVIYAIETLISLHTPQQNLNVSTGIGTSLEDIIKIYLEIGGESKFLREIQAPLHITKNSILDCSSLDQIIEWNPISFKEGFKNILVN
jgi:nucleoside-diphosphate-sugar epimerase